MAVASFVQMVEKSGGSNGYAIFSHCCAFTLNNMALSVAVQNHPKSDIFSLEDILAYYIGERHDQSPITHLRSPLDEALLPLPLSVSNDLLAAPTPATLGSGNVRRKAPVPAHINEKRSQQLIGALSEGRWIDVLFAKKEVLFGRRESRYAWKLERKISEKACFSPNLSYATAIYECSQSKGRVRGPTAYMKVYMQIPSYDDTSKQIRTTPCRIPQEIMNEIATLKHLARAEGDSPAPKLLAIKRKAQTESMWVPGGFFACIVTQRASGSILDTKTYEKFDANTRDEIKLSFRQSLENLWQSGVMPRRCGIEKLSWDDQTRMCHIIDLECAEMINYTVRWWDYEYPLWGLSIAGAEPFETPANLKKADTAAKSKARHIRVMTPSNASQSTLHQANASQPRFIFADPNR